jgi:hypothetical protein
VTRDLLGEEEPALPYKPLTPPPKGGFLKTSALLAAGALLAGLLGYVGYTHYVSLARQTAAPVADTPSPGPKSLAPSPREPAPPEPATLAQPHPEVQEKSLAGPQDSPPAASQLSREAAPVREAVRPENTPPPEPDQRAAEPAPSESGTHRVSAKDGGLLNIVAASYPSEKEIGYDAVILANPQIEHEDVIYIGQILILPNVDKNTKVFTLPNKQYFAIYKRFNNAAQTEKTMSKLKELQLRHILRETRLYGNNKAYRIFLGGYDSKEELQQAMILAEKN